MNAQRIEIGRIVHFKVPKVRCYPAIVTDVRRSDLGVVADLHVFGCPGWEDIPGVRHGDWTEGKRWHWHAEHYHPVETVELVP